MKKILVLTNSIRGLRSFRFELMEKMRAFGNSVVIYCPENNETQDFEKIGCKIGFIKNLDSRGMNILIDLKLALEYISVLKKEKPDVVLTYTAKPNIYGGLACAIKKVPYIANITGLGSALENGGIIQKVMVFLYKIAFLKIHKVFFQNAENMQFFSKNRIAMGKYELLPGSGVNLQKFSYIEYPGDEKIQFAFISRIMKEKGIEQYLEAAEKINKKYPDTIFHVCGGCDKEYEHSLEKLQKNPISLPGEKVKSMPMDQNKLNKQTIVDSYDILVMSSFIRVNIISILKQAINGFVLPAILILTQQHLAIMFRLFQALQRI